MSMVFSAGKRKEIEFEYQFADGTVKKFRWKEMSAKNTGEFLSLANRPDKMMSVAGDLLLESIEGEGKEKMIEELFENASVNTIFKMINELNDSIDKEQIKK